MNEASRDKTAIWIPGWYELDQSIAVGLYRKFWFFRDPPDCVTVDEGADLVFFNQLDSSSNSEVRFARIKSIEHESLGPLARIDTDGLDYVYVPLHGKPVTVNAEERPGEADSVQATIEDWSVRVALTDVSEPVDESV